MSEPKVFVVTSRQMVRNALRSKPGGEAVFQEYNRVKCLSDGTRKRMVNILVEDMMENHGRPPPANIRVSYALGIVTLFPLLKDLNSKNGYEHYYDPHRGSGYLAWRLKTVQRSSSKQCQRYFSINQEGPRTSTNQLGPGPLPTYLDAGGPIANERDATESLSTLQDGPRSLPPNQDGPRIPRLAHSPPPELSTEEFQEAISLMQNFTDESLVRDNMKATFGQRQQMVHDPEAAGPSIGMVLDAFPRFLDTPGLINLDFSLLFGEEVSQRLLSQWETFYKPRIIADCKRLPHGGHVDSLLASLSQPPSSSDAWECDLTVILLLLHLLPPTCQGKRHKKISATEAEDRLLKFLRMDESVGDFLESSESASPYLLCVGERRSCIEKYFVVLDQRSLPCEVNSAISALDELFKAHFVFGQSYDEPLCNFFTFLQTTVYGIDAGCARENPRVREIRARLLNNNEQEV